MTTAIAERDVTPISHAMKFKVMRVDPVMASEMLRNNHPNNRRPKWHKINQYAADMRSGLWRLTHQGIAVDTDGWLVDGQNRLMAVIEADVAVPLLVVTGVPAVSMVAADCMAARTAADAARVVGSAFGKNETAYASTVRFMMSGLRTSTLRPSHQDIINFAKRHKQALDFVFECMPTNRVGLTPSPLRAVIARAWYRRNARARLRAFCEMIYSGLVENVKTDQAVIRLRNWLVTKANTGGERGKIYAKCEDAIAAFLDCREYDRVGTATKEQFPIPDDPSIEDDEP